MASQMELSAEKPREVGYQTVAQRRSKKPYTIGVFSMTVLGFLLSALGALSLPFFDGPDEVMHTNSVTRVIAGGGWPDAYEAPWLGSVKQAVYETGGPYEGMEPHGQPIEADQRSLLFADSDFNDGQLDAMVQHPPLYYMVTAFAVNLFDSSILRWDHAVLLMRLVSAALLASTTPFLIGSVFRVTGRRTPALLAGGVTLCIPFFTVMGSYVSNDVLLVPACTATLYFLIRSLTNQIHKEGWLIAAGVAYGLALATKGFALMLAPAVITFALVTLFRTHGGRIRYGLTIVAAAALTIAIGGWWWIRNLVVYGKIQPSRYGSREHSAIGPDDYNIGSFIFRSLRRFNATFWGRGARPGVAFPEWLTIVFVTILLLVIIIGLVTRYSRLAVALSLIQPVLIFVITFSNAHSIYWDTGEFDRGIQGRYLYAGITALAISVGVCWEHLLRRRKGQAHGQALTAAGILAPALISAAGISWIISKTWTWFWEELGVPKVPIAQYMGIPGWFYAVFLIMILIALLGFLSSTLRTQHQEYNALEPQ